MSENVFILINITFSYILHFFVFTIDVANSLQYQCFSVFFFFFFFGKITITVHGLEKCMSVTYDTKNYELQLHFSASENQLSRMTIKEKFICLQKIKSSEFMTLFLLQ